MRRAVLLLVLALAVAGCPRPLPPPKPPTPPTPGPVMHHDFTWEVVAENGGLSWTLSSRSTPILVTEARA